MHKFVEKIYVSLFLILRGEIDASFDGIAISRFRYFHIIVYHRKNVLLFLKLFVSTFQVEITSSR